MNHWHVSAIVFALFAVATEYDVAQFLFMIAAALFLLSASKGS